MFLEYICAVKYALNYTIEIQFLGFRFSGWQKQTNAKTVHDSIDKSLSFVFEHTNFKTIGVGRTDAKVSANSYYIQLFIDEEVNEVSFLESLNRNFPNDFRAISIEKIDKEFNIINASKLKEYHYYFSFGEKNHPFAAPFIVGVLEELNIDLMKQGAKLFEGEHYFHKYCTKPSEKTIFKRIIATCEIVKNDVLTASFFPKKSYVLKVKGKGFLRYQIRLMMATLFELGRENISLEIIKNSLKEDNDRAPLKSIAPASGLQLYDVSFEDR